MRQGLYCLVKRKYPMAAESSAITTSRIGVQSKGFFFFFSRRSGSLAFFTVRRGGGAGG